MRPKRERNVKTKIKRWKKQQRQLERRNGQTRGDSGDAPAPVDAEGVRRLVDQILSGKVDVNGYAGNLATDEVR